MRVLGGGLRVEPGRGGSLLPSLLERSQAYRKSGRDRGRGVGRGDGGQGHAVDRHPWTSFQGETSVIESSCPGRRGLELTKPNFP